MAELGADATAAVEYLRSIGHGSMDGPYIAWKLGWGQDRARKALREAEAAGLVTSRRGGGMSHGRPLWWTVADG